MGSSAGWSLCDWNVRQTGLLLQPCVGSLQLLCPCPEGGNATVKLSPNCTAVELNNNHRTLGTHNSYAGPFVLFLSPSPILDRDTSFNFILPAISLSVKC